jgi:hypothetical protein
MDNLNIHHNPLVLHLIRQRGHRVVFRAPYRPQDGPIEYVFNTIETGLTAAMHAIHHPWLGKFLRVLLSLRIPLITHRMTANADVPRLSSAGHPTQLQTTHIVSRSQFHIADMRSGEDNTVDLEMKLALVLALYTLSLYWF